MPRRVVRHLCLGCRAQPARFRFRGRVRADRDHDLCFRCYRAESNRLRARSIAGNWRARHAGRRGFSPEATA